MDIKKLPMPSFGFSSPITKKMDFSYSSFACSLSALSREITSNQHCNYSVNVQQLVRANAVLPEYLREIIFKMLQTFSDIMLSVQQDKCSVYASERLHFIKDWMKKTNLCFSTRTEVWPETLLCLIRTKLHLFPAESLKGAVKSSCSWL